MTKPARLTVIKRQPVVDSPSVERTSIAFARADDLTLTEYPADTARFRFSVGGNFQGLLIEHDPYQSVIADSEDFAAAGWNLDGATIAGNEDGPDGITDSATTIDATGGAGIEYGLTEVGETTFDWTGASRWATQTVVYSGTGAAPTLEAVGAQQVSTNPLTQTVAMPAGVQTGDVLHLVVSHYSVSQIAPYDLSAQGWDFVGASVNIADRLYLATYSKISDGTETGVNLPSLGNSGPADRVRIARVLVIRGADELVFSGEDNDGNSIAETGTWPGYSGLTKPSLLLFFAHFPFSSSKPITNVQNDNVALTVDVNGEGTTSGDATAMVIAHASVDNTGVIPSGDARMSAFFRRASGAGETVKLYNPLGGQEAVFDASSGAVISGDGTSEIYSNAFFRFSLGISSSADPIGFGLEFDGVMDVFGANLMPSYGPHQYMINDTEFTGDTEMPYTGASLVYSNIPEPAPQDAGPNGPATIWEAGNYNTNDQVVYSDHFVYRAATTTTTVPDVGVNETPPKWVRIGPSARWKMFIAQEPGVDGVVYGVEMATVGDEFVETLMAPTAGDYIPAYAVHGMDAGVLIETIYNGETIVSEREINLVSNEGVTDWLLFFQLDRAHIEQFYSGDLQYNPDFRLKLRWEGGEAPVVGKLVIGDPKEIGFTIDKIDIRDRTFGTKERDENGNLIYERGRSTNTITYRAWVEKDRKSYAEQQLKVIGTDPTSYIGLLDDELTMAYGTRDNRNLSFNLFEARMSVQVETV